MTKVRFQAALAEHQRYGPELEERLRQRQIVVWSRRR